ncbi:hypothetical protein EJB05_09725, partial [Eragrostis curvula]
MKTLDGEEGPAHFRFCTNIIRYLLFQQSDAGVVLFDFVALLHIDVHMILAIWREYTSRPSRPKLRAETLASQHYKEVELLAVELRFQ